MTEGGDERIDCEEFTSINTVDCTYRHGKGVGGGVDGGGVGGGGQAVHLGLHGGDDDPGSPLNPFDVVRPAAALGHVLHPHLGHMRNNRTLACLYI